MKSIKVILLITVVLAKRNISHIRSTLEPKENFFDKINVDIHNITNNIFVTLLNHRFAESPKNKLYLSMHNDLNSMAEKNYEVYVEMKNISKPAADNTIIKKFFSVSDVIKEILYKEIYGEPDIGIYDNNITSDIENSVEFANFVLNFESKINKLSIDDLFKQPHNDTDQQRRRKEPDLSKRNLKAWRPREVLHNATRRLYRGTSSRVSHYPFVASIHVLGQLICAGSIISKDLVITAASCLQTLHNNKMFRENPKSLSVRVGSSYATRTGDMIDAAEVHFYPAYNPENLFHNLAIIRLRRHIRFSSQIRSIKRILLDKHKGILPSNVPSVVVLGWGATDRSNIVGLLPKLSVSVLDVYALEECKDVYSRYYVTDKNFCAGFVSKGGGACNKDAGGPGVVGGYLTGVISFGPPACGTVDAPTVFTRVGYYIEWIEQIMGTTRVTNKVSTTSRPRIPFGPPVTPYIPTRGPVHPIALRNGSSRASMEAILLKQILNEVIFSKSTVLEELMYEAPDWEDDDFNDIFITQPENVPSTVIPDDFLYGPMDADNIFETTEKPDLLEHPLINKSLIFIPEKYGIYETSTPEFKLPTVSTTPRPWMTTPIADEETTVHPLALRTQLSLERNFDSESFDNNYEYREPDSDESASDENHYLEIENREDAKNVGRQSQAQNLDQGNHMKHDEKRKQLNHKLKNTTPVESEDGDEEDDEKDMGYESLREDISYREQYNKLDPKLLNVKDVGSENTDEEDGTENIKYDEKYKTNPKSKHHTTQSITGYIINENTEVYETTNTYHNSLPVKMYDEKHKQLGANLKSTTPDDDESTDEEPGTGNTYHESLKKENNHKTYVKMSTKPKNELPVESEVDNKEVGAKVNDHKSLKEEKYHEKYNKMDTESKNKVLFESDNSEQHDTKNNNHKALREDNNRGKYKNANTELKNKVLFDRENSDVAHRTKSVQHESLREFKNQEEDTLDTRIKKEFQKNARPTNYAASSLDVDGRGKYETNMKLKLKDSQTTKPKNWQSRDTTDDYIKRLIRDHNWDTKKIMHLLDASPSGQGDRHNLVTSRQAGETTRHVDHGHQMGRTMIVKHDNMDKFEDE